MSIDSLVQLEARIQETQSLNPQQKEEFLRLLADLKEAIAELSTTHAEHAHSITRFTDISTYEATRQHKNPHLLRLAMEGLSTSVEEFEASHPALVNTVNQLSTLLANMGI
jgi:Domain of unknown function (DUF4404)